MNELGGKRIISLGLGDDKAEEKFETEFWEWLPNVCTEMNYKAASMELPEKIYDVNIYSVC